MSLDSRLRFFKHILLQENGCWLWSSYVHKNGYGRVIIDGKVRLSHRISWLIHRGQIPSQIDGHKTFICHTCDNRACVNPDHLYLGNHIQNMNDMKVRNRADRRYGNKNKAAKLNREKAQEIRKFYHDNSLSQDKVAFIYGVSQKTISDIVVGKRWA